MAAGTNQIKRADKATAFSLGELRRLVGSEGVNRCLLHFSGTRIYVPADRFGDSVLGRAVGADIAEMMGGRWGGTIISVPNNRAAQVQRNVLDGTKGGLSPRAIARRLRVTERRVYQVIRELREAGALS